MCHTHNPANMELNSFGKTLNPLDSIADQAQAVAKKADNAA